LLASRTVDFVKYVTAVGIHEEMFNVNTMGLNSGISILVTFISSTAKFLRKVLTLDCSKIS